MSDPRSSQRPAKSLADALSTANASGPRSSARADGTNWTKLGWMNWLDRHHVRDVAGPLVELRLAAG
jgi:hypothetical protein